MAANLAYSIALDFFHYNFIRIHQTLRKAPAMAAGIAEYPMTIEDIVEMLPLPVVKNRGRTRSDRRHLNKKARLMPNGKPGDSPHTDIANHRAEIYGSEIDALSREIESLGSDTVRRAVFDLLWDYYPIGSTPELDKLLKKLIALKSTLNG